MVEMMEEVMDLVYEHLAPAEIDAHYEEIVHLPDVLMAHADDTLEGITIGKLVSGNGIDLRKHGEPEPKLLIATKFRIVLPRVSTWGVRGTLNAPYSEIVAVNYSDGRLKIRKIGEDSEFELCAEKSPEHFLNTLHQRVFVRYNEIMKKVMSVALKQLSPMNIDYYHKEIMYIPEVLMSRDGIETLEGVIMVSRAYHSLLIATDLRLIDVVEENEKAKVSWDVLYSEIEAVHYSHYSPTHHGRHDRFHPGSLEVRKKKGWIKTTRFILIKYKSSNPLEFLDVLRRYIPVFVDGSPFAGLSNKIELADDTMVSDDTVMARQFADFLRDKLDIHDAVLEQDTSAADEQPKEEQQSSPPVVQSDVSVADELRKFAELRDLGIITDEEFEAQKAKLLKM